MIFMFQDIILWCKDDTDTCIISSRKYAEVSKEYLKV